MPTDNRTQEINSLEEIRKRKDLLLEDIRKDDDVIKEKWEDLFYDRVSPNASSSQRFVGMMNTGLGIADGLIMGWKLYRKFSGFRLFGRKR
jgi:hypothetical protein